VRALMAEEIRRRQKRPSNDRNLRGDDGKGTGNRIRRLRTPGSSTEDPVSCCLKGLLHVV